MNEIADSEFPSLFAHGTRKDWGVGVLAGVRDGKRTYLFEGGEERVMGGGAYDMMRRLTRLDESQQSTLARLTALVARRHGVPDAAKTAGMVLLEQLANLRRVFPQGLVDPAWQGEKRAALVRDTVSSQARELLSLEVLDAQLQAQQFDAVWASASKVLNATGWLAADQLKPAPTFGLGLLSGAVRELLYGSARVEQRIDRFSVAFETAFRRPPRWETTTALLALVHPSEHVLIDLTAFRKQLRNLGAKATLPQSPNGAGYVRCLSAARVVASKLTENGEVPQDLLDVHDVIRFTLKAAVPARRAKAPKAAKTPKKKRPSVEAEDAEHSAD
jgi:hypothetical protein